jgi:CcmD family protein
MMYLVAAYAFAIAVLGGYLAWSLLRLRELQRKQ